MSKEINEKEVAKKEKKKEFTNILLNSNLDKKIVSEILYEEKTFAVFFHIFLLGEKNIHEKIKQINESKEEARNAGKE